jgi:hypothetical protein
MARIVLGIGTSHTTMMSVPAELWKWFGAIDERRSDLVYPPHATVLDYQHGVASSSPEIHAEPRDLATFQRQRRP